MLERSRTFGGQAWSWTDNEVNLGEWWKLELLVNTDAAVENDKSSSNWVVKVVETFAIVVEVVVTVIAVVIIIIVVVVAVIVVVVVVVVVIVIIVVIMVQSHPFGQSPLKNPNF